MMLQDESDSSDAESSHYAATNVLLGYASKEPTNDSFSQLGGRPIWPTSASTLSSTLARCKCCSAMMTLLLQLYADLPAQFPGHERRLYIFSCKKKACRRREGSLCVMRGTKSASRSQKVKDKASIQTQHRIDDTQKIEKHREPTRENLQPDIRLGDRVFNSKFNSSSDPGQNPFARHQHHEPQRPPDDRYYQPKANPFASSHPPAPTASSSTGTAIDQQASSPASNPESKVQDLATTLAQKVHITDTSASPQLISAPKEPWPSESDLPSPYPSYYLDADNEILDPSPSPTSTPAASKPSKTMEIDPLDSANDVFEKEAFESSLDKTFQRFADRVAQNPEQVLRYEYGGQPLLYSTTDAVGKLFHHHHQDFIGNKTSATRGVKTVTGGAGTTKIKAIPIPPCANCGAGRVFEMQLMPEAIAQLEVEEEGLDGMEWGTVLVGVCGVDCGGVGGDDDEEGSSSGSSGGWKWVEEWCGVQWEEEVVKSAAGGM